MGRFPAAERQGGLVDCGPPSGDGCLVVRRGATPVCRPADWRTDCGTPGGYRPDRIQSREGRRGLGRRTEDVLRHASPAYEIRATQDAIRTRDGKSCSSSCLIFWMKRGVLLKAWAGAAFHSA